MYFYGFLYAGGGTAGIDDDVLRDPQERARLKTLFDAWVPDYGPGYDPGWVPGRRGERGRYQSTIAEAKAGMAEYFDMVSKLVSDDQYYAAHNQYKQVMARFPKDGLAPDHPDAKLMDELRKRKRERAIALGVDVGPEPPDLSKPEEREKLFANREDRFPPSSPAADERVVSGEGNRMVERCMDFAEANATTRGAKLVATLTTSSPTWGVIWRGDIEGGQGEPERMICSESSTASGPREVDAKPLPRVGS
jgi:hypothetical protein